MMVDVRRTPALTKQARELFEEEFLHGGWQPGGTCPRIAALTGLSPSQVRDALFGKSSDTWRRDFGKRYAEERKDGHASS